MQVHRRFSRKLALSVKNGAVGVLPTDTIYGLVGSALSKRVVARVYELKKRSARKPLILLISSLKDLGLFKIKLDRKTARVLKRVWPGQLSVLLPVSGKRFFYIHRGTERIAFRLPAKVGLRKFLKKTGPLIATSANWEGYPLARNIREAKDYFGEKADFYFDGGTLNSAHSTLIAVQDGRVRIMRRGAGKVKESVIN
ncbi:MAG: L-threonylcarbamoyladenylate synthase [Minisyncoccia bacterium]|jgi:L-threonylcarbamoyladenylate synthase